MKQTITLNEITDLHNIVDELTYRCYAYNRQRTPQYPPEQWKCVFGNVDAMEKRFQAEVK